VSRAKQEICADGMGPAIILRCKNFLSAMSALGSLADMVARIAMSAVTPIVLQNSD
jgi:hypothetical protein